jgi:integrase
VKERRVSEKSWGKSIATMREERHALGSFQELVAPVWCHEITTQNRETFIQERLQQVDSAGSVEKDLRLLRHLFNKLEEWHHVPKGTNPFSGNGRATVGMKRRREKELVRKQSGNAKAKFYTIEQVQAILAQADKEANASPQDWEKHRLRALVYFEAHTGVRVDEVLHLGWKEIDFDAGIALVNFKVEHHLKTESSEARVGLAEPLLAVLRCWKEQATCSWVFPNSRMRPWTGGSRGDKSLDQLKALAKRAKVEHATWQMFRHRLSTLGKSAFDLTAERVQAQLRHTTTKTQKTYTHDDLEGLRRTANAMCFTKTPEKAGPGDTTPETATGPVDSAAEAPPP